MLAPHVRTLARANYPPIYICMRSKDAQSNTKESSSRFRHNFEIALFQVPIFDEESPYFGNFSAK